MRLCAVLMLATATAAQALTDAATTGKLADLVARSLNYQTLTMDERQRAVNDALAMLAASDLPQPYERASIALAHAYLLYQGGQLSAAIDTLRNGRALISVDTHPALYVRCTSLLAGLLTTAGQKEEGLQTLETLLSSDLTAVPQTRVENARVNYASTLVQVGRVQDAGRAYEQAIMYGLSQEEDLLALTAGSNYFALLNDQGLFAEGEYWLKQLQPAMARTPKVMATAALELYQYGLLLTAGKAEEALPKLEAFLARATDGPTLVTAHGQELYSDALRTLGRLDEALQAARASLALLANFPLEQPEARIAIVRTLLAMEDYDAAGAELALLRRSDVSTPANRASHDQLRLEHAVRTGNTRQAAEAFDDYVQSNAVLTDFVNTRQADHYADKLRTQRAELELKLSREAQALLQAEATAQKAQASELRTREASNRETRNLQIGLVVILALSAIGLIFFMARRRVERQIQQRLGEQNTTLAKLVDLKSRDLVEKVMEQAELKQALAERRHLEAVGQIAGHVAHDFNNVLQVVASTNELLAANTHSDTQDKALSASNQSVRSGSATVRQLLAYSRNQQLEARLLRITDYLNDNTALFQSAVGDINRLTVDNQAPQAIVRLDSGQLTASIINLLRNAADAMDAPGEIVLRAVAVPGSQDPEPDSTAPSVALQVIDQGRGMNAQEVEHAREPYYTTKSSETGTGLGLSSVYGFVAQSGGEIAINSEPGTGTAVTLRFPEVQGTVPPAPAQPPADVTLAGARLLLVEDNPLIAKTLQALLGKHGAQSQWAETADAAREVLGSGTGFDLMLSDIKIPGAMDGFGLARWARANHPAMHIGMMSGYGPTADEDFDIPVLSKPFTGAELISYLNERIGAATS
jgi:signal transduction histidine kinase